MDLGSIKTKDISVVELKLPNGITITNDDGTPMTITVHGLYSEKYRQAVDVQQAARVKRAQSSGGRLNITPEEMRSDRMKLVSEMIYEWDITLDGTKPKFSTNLAKDIFERLPFIYEQLNDVLEDRQTFLDMQSKS